MLAFLLEIRWYHDAFVLCWWGLFLLIIKIYIKVGDIIKKWALIFVILGIIIILKYLFKSNKSIINIDKSLLEDIKNDKDKKDTPKENNDYLGEMFSDKGSIFLMIGLFLFFIAIILYIYFRRFF